MASTGDIQKEFARVIVQVNFFTFSFWRWLNCLYYKFATKFLRPDARPQLTSLKRMVSYVFASNVSNVTAIRQQGRDNKYKFEILKKTFSAQNKIFQIVSKAKWIRKLIKQFAVHHASSLSLSLSLSFSLSLSLSLQNQPNYSACDRKAL